MKISNIFCALMFLFAFIQNNYSKTYSSLCFEIKCLNTLRPIECKTQLANENFEASPTLYILINVKRHEFTHMIYAVVNIRRNLLLLGTQGTILSTKFIILLKYDLGMSTYIFSVKEGTNEE